MPPEGCRDAPAIPKMTSTDRNSFLHLLRILNASSRDAFHFVALVNLFGLPHAVELAERQKLFGAPHA